MVCRKPPVSVSGFLNLDNKTIDPLSQQLVSCLGKFGWKYSDIRPVEQKQRAFPGLLLVANSWGSWAPTEKRSHGWEIAADEGLSEKVDRALTWRGSDALTLPQQPPEWQFPQSGSRDREEEILRSTRSPRKSPSEFSYPIPLLRDT